jgi:hypothetical protein
MTLAYSERTLLLAGEPKKGTIHCPYVAYPLGIEIFMTEMEHLAKDTRVKKCDRY